MCTSVKYKYLIIILSSSADYIVCLLTNVQFKFVNMNIWYIKRKWY